MIPTLLLDLDDTLLDTNLETFLPAYFQAFVSAFAADVDPQTTLAALLGGTRRMMANEDPSKTLQEVFDAYFFPKIGIERRVLQPKIDAFYGEIFPTLQEFTKPIPGAVDLVESAFEQGYRVVVATDPYFPLHATRQRMAWAGLPHDRYPFALVSSYETFHFGKATPAFYTETLAQLGWPEGPVVMVGDDIDRDMLPSAQLGIPFFWIENSRSTLPPGLDVSGCGRITEVRPWLERILPGAPPPDFAQPEALVPVLRSTPAAIDHLTRNLTNEDWHCAPAPGEWCLVKLMCHLRDVEREVNLARVKKIMAEENPFIPGEVTDDWIETRDYAHQDGQTALRDFTAARIETISLLAAMDAASWSRPARHNIFGPSTLQELVGFVAEHDRSHVRQVIEILSATGLG